MSAPVARSPEKRLPRPDRGVTFGLETRRSSEHCRDMVRVMLRDVLLLLHHRGAAADLAERPFIETFAARR